MHNLNIKERFQWILENYRNEVIASTSFGAQSVVLLHLLKEYALQIPIVFIDTGYLFAETYQYADQLIRDFGLDVKIYSPSVTAARLESLYGKLWEGSEDDWERYGILTKIEPMNRALKDHGARVWISGLRRLQTELRKEFNYVVKQKRTTKIYPILDWSNKQIEEYIKNHQLPQHPLLKRGYVSIGDWHSTKPIINGVKPEEVRFHRKKCECGLHLPSNIDEYQI